MISEPAHATLTDRADWLRSMSTMHLDAAMPNGR
jgi:hypothetical protein